MPGSDFQQPEYDKSYLSGYLKGQIIGNNLQYGVDVPVNSVDTPLMTGCFKILRR